MATVINNPGTSEESGGNNPVMIVVLLLVVILVVWFFVVPLFQGGDQTSPTENVQNNVQQPAPDDGGTEVNIPDEVDVNVEGGEGSE